MRAKGHCTLKNRIGSLANFPECYNDLKNLKPYSLNLALKKILNRVKTVETYKHHITPLSSALNRPTFCAQALATVTRSVQRTCASSMGQAGQASSTILVLGRIKIHLYILCYTMLYSVILCSIKSKVKGAESGKGASKSRCPDLSSSIFARSAKAPQR